MEQKKFVVFVKYFLDAIMDENDVDGRVLKFSNWDKFEEFRFHLIDDGGEILETAIVPVDRVGEIETISAMLKTSPLKVGLAKTF